MPSRNVPPSTSFFSKLESRGQAMSYIASIVLLGQRTRPFIFARATRLLTTTQGRRSIQFLLQQIFLAIAVLVAAEDCCKARTSTESAETPKEHPLAAEFRARDRDRDGLLSEEEYINGGGPEKLVLRRNFLVFDANNDGRMDLPEFLTVPGSQPEDERGVLPDPVVLLSKAKLSDLTRRWKDWDLDGNDALTKEEFSKSDIGSRIAGLEGTEFNDWDLNRDCRVSLEEVAQVLDMACGVCTPSGEPVRSNTGRVVDWIMFRGLKKNENGFVRREEYLRVLGTAVADKEAWYFSIDKNGDGLFNFAEFATGNHRTDPVATFLQLDVDLDGRLSGAELAPLPESWRQMARHAFRGFDDDRDELLSLREYQFMPHCNLLATWQSAVDSNQDGKLSRDEFQFMPGVPLATLTAEYFRRLDTNGDDALSLDEWPFSTNHPGAKFRVLDQDSDGFLTGDEFSAEGSLPAKQMLRDLKVFDVDEDLCLSFDEFMSLPYWIPEDKRGAPPDPVLRLAEDLVKQIGRHWGEWDKDADGLLSSSEFDNAQLGRQEKKQSRDANGTRIPGLDATTFNDWDFDWDGQISPDEAGKLVEIASGVRTPEGELMRSKSGRVVDWRLFRTFKLDPEGFVSRSVYFQALGNHPDREAWYASNDQNRDGKFNFAEFASGNHRTDPVANFLQLDVDFSGTLTSEELEGLPADRFPVGHFLFPAFDDNQDQVLSLAEFRFSPVVNLLAPWNVAKDLDGNGQLSLEEFRFYPGAHLATLSAEYFRRLDVDLDQSLSLDEFPFVTSHPSASETEIRVQFADGELMVIAIPDYPIICSPEISPNNKWVAVDGWKQGQNNLAAHILVASLETDEVRDLGTACIPHWSADGRRLAYSKYSGGVFLRDFEGNADTEESIDPQGWSIHFSTDGKKTAYVQQGNLVIYDLKTGQKKLIFHVGKSPYTYIEHNFTWSPDSQRICFKGHRSDGNIDVGIVFTEGDDPKLQTRCDGKDVQSDFSWLPDGKRLMFPKIPAPGQRMQIYELDPDGDEPATRYPRQPKNRSNGGLCWSRDGKVFVYMSTR